MTRIIDTYGLSPMQAGMLVHCLGNGHCGSYIEQVAVTLREPLDEVQWVRAWQRLSERHPVLRSRFRWRGVAEPVQEILERVEIPVERLDWRALPEAERESRFEALLERERLRGFEFDQAPLMRLALIRAAEAEHWLLWTFHHILLDGWSRPLLVAEAFALYEAFSRGAGDEQPAPRPYRDHIEWLGRLDHQAAKAYWQRELAGFKAPTPLVVTREAAAPPSGEGPCAMHETRLPAALTAALRKRAREASVTLNTVLQGAWALLLHRYSGEPEVVFGVTRACRGSGLEGAAEMVGLFINTLPLRASIDPEAEAAGWLRQLREQQAAVRDYEHTPLVSVQGWSEVPRGMPLFESILVFNSATDEARLRALGGAWSERRIRYRGQTHYPLTLAVYDGVELLLQIEYACERFERDVVVRMLGHLQTLLEGLAAHPHSPLKDLPLLTEAERHQVLEAWNQTSIAHPAPQCAHELFEERARIAPDALAAEAGGCAVSYAELDRRAEQIAAQLRRHGVQPDSLVALYLERSIEMLAGILGVWKAGAAYVPIDPEYPAERVRFMLEDTQALVTLTVKRLAAALPAANCAVVQVDAALDAPPEDAAPGAVRPRASPERLAYVIYTSGSTGRPKGVPITHRALFNLICWHRQAYAVTPNDRATQIAGPAFDGSVWEIWPYLTAGASVHIPDEATRLDAAGLVRWLASRRISVSFLPTPLAEAALRESWPATSALRALLTGGDRLQAAPKRKLPFRLVNHYGPTENTVVSTCAEVAAQDGPAPPIGRPLPNTEAYVLDPHLQPVPVGVPGELLVGGAQLSPGYWKRPELTAQKFIAHPFRAEPGARLYRTGDRVRYLADGNIEFLGRIDHQVKIRGFRIELGEIEAALKRQPAVREALVLAREDIPGEKQLVAYVTLAEGASLAVEEMRAALKRELPGYMVPAAFVRLAKVPLTPNGKPDRAALPAPAPRAAHRSEPPVGEIESTLARIWCDLLKLERVGRHDHFFELGGHSLLAVGMIERMRRAGLSADVRSIFAHPTLAALAATLGTTEPASGVSAPLVQLTPADMERIVRAVPGGAANIADIYPLTPLQEGMLFHHLTAAEGDPYVLCTRYGFDSRARLDAYLRALQAVIDRHEALRSAVLWEGLAEPVQVVWRRAPLAVHEIGAAAAFDWRRWRLDIREAPLARIFIARDARNGRWLMWQLVHHLALDHAALEVLDGELRAHLAGRSRELGTPARFRDYVAQVRLAAGAADEAFFHAMLGELREPAAPVSASAACAEARRQVDATLARRVRACALSLGVGAAALCHLAWALVLARLSQRDEVVFGTVLSGRPDSGAGAAPALGMFLNTLPLRVRLGPLGVREAVRDTHLLLAELLRRQHARPLPVFSALFNYRHSAAAASAGVAAPGIERLGFDERTHYPLSLSVDDFGDAFALSAQAQPPLDPQRVCALMHAALDELAGALESAPATPLASLAQPGSGPRRAPSAPTPAHLAEKPRIAPRTEWERRLARIWQDLLGIGEPAADDSFFDLGGHSLAVVRLIGEINRRHQVTLGAAEVLRNPTLAQMASLAERQPKGRRQPAVIELKAGRVGPPVYFMYAGPNEFGLAQLLSERHQVFGIEVPWPLAWRDAVAANRKSAFPTIHELAARYAAVLSAHAGSKPCVLAGHSFGGLIAFEAAQELVRQGGSVRLVMLFDASVTSPNPYRVAWRQWRTGGDTSRSRIARWLWRHHKYRLWLWLNRLRANSNLTSVLDEQGTPLPWKLLERLYLHNVRCYRPRRLESRGVLFRTYAGDVDKAVHAFDDNLGWSGLFGGGLELIPIPGDHLSIMREHNAALARQMEQVLGQHGSGEISTGGIHAHEPQSLIHVPATGAIASLDALQR